MVGVVLEVFLRDLVHMGHQVIEQKLYHARGLGLLLLGIAFRVQGLEEERAKLHHRVPDVL